MVDRDNNQILVQCLVIGFLLLSCRKGLKPKTCFPHSALKMRIYKTETVTVDVALGMAEKDRNEARLRKQDD